MADSYCDARQVEAKGMEALTPFLNEVSDGRFVILDKGPLAKVLQQTDGDAILQTRGNGVWSVEIKVESRHTGNLFLESWSNKNLDSFENHVRIGSNPGWMLKLKSMLLLYYFLDVDKLYVINLFRLQQWAFGAEGRKPRVYSFPDVRQGRHVQLNDTHGWLVPLPVIHQEVGYKLVHPKQIPLFEEEIFPRKSA